MGQHFAAESAATRAPGSFSTLHEACRVRAHVIPKTCELARRLQCTVYVRGVITNREVLQNLGLIYREFGVACLARCLWVVMTRKSTTFLEVVLPRR